MSARRIVAAIALLCAALAAAACGSSGGGDDGSGDAAQAPSQEAQAGGFRLVKAVGNLGDALFVTAGPGPAGRLYVVQQSGRIRILHKGRLPGTFLDISGIISSGRRAAACSGWRSIPTTRATDVSS